MKADLVTYKYSNLTVLQKDILNSINTIEGMEISKLRVHISPEHFKKFQEDLQSSGLFFTPDTVKVGDSTFYKVGDIDVEFKIKEKDLPF